MSGKQPAENVPSHKNSTYKHPEGVIVMMYFKASLSTTEYQEDKATELQTGCRLRPDHQSLFVHSKHFEFSLLKDHLNCENDTIQHIP